MTEYQVELLAPAGNKEAFLGAIHAGADAVYLAGNQYGARAYADNFTTEELLFCIRYAHLFGRRVYLTVNTLIKETELAALYEYVVPFYEAGLDACIVQDLGAFQCLKNWFPQMELHVSTQMTITGVYGARLLKELGATRIVPARELSLAEIRKMKEASGLEIEAFIHGAMCYCYSGQCLFSSILGGRSGNRGRCAQPCRLPYRVNIGKGDSKECYPLSLKDMCTIEHLEALMEAGIDSFKIEGRMKKPEYAAGVTAIYRKYIDLKKKNPDRKLSFHKGDLEQLSRLYIRSERQEGYYFKQNSADMVTLDSPAYSGSEDALLQEIHQKYIERKPCKKTAIYASLICGEKVTVTMLHENLSVTVEGDVAERAQKLPLSLESIEKQLGKLGDTIFEAEIIEVYTDGESFYPLKALNELRRRAVQKLEDLLIESYGLPNHRSLEKAETEEGACEEDRKKASSRSSLQKGALSSDNMRDWTVVLSTKAQVKAFADYLRTGALWFSHIYLESELLLNTAETGSLLSSGRLYIALPYCMRDKDTERLEQLLEYAKTHPIQGFLVRNLEEYAYLKEQNYEGEIHGDGSLYIWNREAMHFWQDRLSGISCPLELNRREWQRLFEGQTFEKLIFGRIPMMVTANCIVKTTDKCHHGKETTMGTLTDRYKKQFPVAVSCAYCMNIIYNSVPLSLHKEVAEGRAQYTKRLLFTIENEQETREILVFFEKTARKELPVPPFGEYTTAHEKRGVE